MRRSFEEPADDSDELSFDEFIKWTSFALSQSLMEKLSWREFGVAI